MAKSKRTPMRQIVAAREFRMLDTQGRLRGFFGMQEVQGHDLPVVALLDEHGVARLTLALNENAESMIFLTDSAEKALLKLVMQNDGTLVSDRPYTITPPPPAVSASEDKKNPE